MWYQYYWDTVSYYEGGEIRQLIGITTLIKALTCMFTIAGVTATTW